MRDGKIVLTICVLAALTFGMWFLPGLPFNRHEWLNDTMKQEGQPWTATVAVDNRDTMHSYWLEMGVNSTATIDLSKCNYTFMKVTTPDHRCFVVDICLKHGETRLQKCVP